MASIENRSHHQVTVKNRDDLTQPEQLPSDVQAAFLNSESKRTNQH